ncbi:hypothetical protein AB0E62_26345 [Streptomyces sp. NPDC038707]|uniref:hypothetical protein n=1 Tax=unclassified Streptomyces TaxID=2593676 RepID=UPI0033DFB7BC
MRLSPHHGAVRRRPSARRRVTAAVALCAAGLVLSGPAAAVPDRAAAAPAAGLPYQDAALPGARTTFGLTANGTAGTPSPHCAGT